MKISVYSQSGEKIKDMQVPGVFDITVSPKAVTLYINYLRAALRSPIANTKDRGAVSGGGRKPYKQKGTGNARAGSTRSPLWVGGGVTFGPTSDRNFRVRINSKEKKRVICGIFADLIRSSKVMIVDDMTLAEIKTKKAATILTNVKAEGKISVVVMSTDANTLLSFRNIAGVHVMTPHKLDIISMMSSDAVVISQAAFDKFVETYAGSVKVKKVEKAEVKAEKAEGATESRSEGIGKEKTEVVTEKAEEKPAVKKPSVKTKKVETKPKTEKKK